MVNRLSSTPTMTSPAKISRLDAALQALQEGRMVIVVDAADRENEGDLICAAEFATPEIINFMLREAAGLLCAPMSREVAERLKLPPMVDPSANTSLHQTPFLVKIDHRDAGSGVSSANRAKTINALADPASRPDDFVRPGHVDPLVARDGGVLRRAGHTEAVVDLLRMAGLQPVGCLIEILSRHADGEGMADMVELEEMSTYRSSRSPRSSSIAAFVNGSLRGKSMSRSRQSCLGPQGSSPTAWSTTTKSHWPSSGGI
jgi:3,4-dihydroxy 2-butanone 4-phosphate synthase / GTP cyclohydrolase II